jgi:hypothetical protein
MSIILYLGRDAPFSSTLSGISFLVLPPKRNASAINEALPQGIKEVPHSLSLGPVQSGQFALLWLYRERPRHRDIVPLDAGQQEANPNQHSNGGGKSDRRAREF